MHAEELIALWKAWDEAPGNTAAIKALIHAQNAYAGNRSLELVRHVAAQRRAGMSMSAAVYTWNRE